MPYVDSVRNEDSFAIEFKPSKRHACKKIPIQERAHKEANELARVAKKLKCQRADHAKRLKKGPTRQKHAPKKPYPPSPRAQKKQRRYEVIDDEPDDVVCCVHGDPCTRHRDRPSDDWIVRMSKLVAGHMKDFFIPKHSRDHPRSRMKSVIGKRSSSPREVHHSLHDEESEPSQRSMHRSRHNDRWEPSGGSVHRSWHDDGWEPSQHSVQRSFHDKDPDEQEPEPSWKSAHHSIHDEEHERSKEHELSKRSDRHTVHDNGSRSVHGDAMHALQDTPQPIISSSFKDPDVGDEEQSSTLPPRLIRPSAYLRSPYVVPTPRNVRDNKRLYQKFRESGRDSVVKLTPTEHTITQEFFDEVENPNMELTAEVIYFFHLFISYWNPLNHLLFIYLLMWLILDA